VISGEDPVQISVVDDAGNVVYVDVPRDAIKRLSVTLGGAFVPTTEAPIDRSHSVDYQLIILIAGGLALLMIKVLGHMALLLLAEKKANPNQ
jgi:hypothetical protein